MTGHSQGRRRFLGGAGAWLGASLAGLRADRENFHTVSIIHTTDLHGHIVPTRTYEGLENVGGFARCATRIRQWRREKPDSLLVDLGDVWQGTAESYLEKGRLMMRLFNLLEYDAWTLGNHDFDWGRGALEANLALSKPAVLTGNLRVDGKVPGALDGAWKSVLPWVMREVGGFRIALIGLVTPGLPYWLPPELLDGAEVLDPLDALRRSVAEARANKADAVVVTGHMGFRERDDFANPVRGILKQVPGVDVYLGGHTHQNQPLWKLGNVFCSQAAYHGIYCGRVDLTFDRTSRKLIGRDAMTELMDARFEPDAAVMDLAGPDIRTASEQLARKLAVVKTPVKSGGADNPLGTLFCECFAEALTQNGNPVDGVFHGTFGSGDVPAGELTVADCWKMLPYENLLVTAELGTTELIEILRMERGLRGSDRILWPFQLRLDGSGAVRSFTHRGKPVAEDARFTIAFNSYDAQSGGQSMMPLRDILSRPAAKRRFTGIETRNALIDGLLRRGEIGA
ncbi:MAG: bifunctional metallophosphatase/5'-nucleotidase [Akkermansiaceae bacterium]|jgi:2',3'-cyclic-nucleotide 2'-phosphodiesterase (5'-nucleotidase family)|nr:bifunctional metallophosphatase/5'-nucleotidase [Akkermansiaceae bacterium]MCU0777352.1 bifunctional metallophosphatase/5'-nucleotidase [Akkermansiaceae bacterium]